MPYVCKNHLSMWNQLNEILKDFNDSKEYLKDENKEQEMEQILDLMGRCIKMYHEELTRDKRVKNLSDEFAEICGKYLLKSVST